MSISWETDLHIKDYNSIIQYGQYDDLTYTG